MAVAPKKDEAAMALAIEVASHSRLSTSPRPSVGALVVPPGWSPRDAAAAGYLGATDGQSGPHAEVVALRAAGEAARGATVYVTLEPCSHWGATPPCADALIEAGVARVVAGVADPDLKVSGQGLARLRSAAIEVAVGVCAGAVEEQLAAYLHHRRTGRPYVVLKLAATLDGATAAPDGTSQWITGTQARADAHLLRAQSDAVLVGAGTVRADDPSLTVRDLPAEAFGLARKGDPLRVVLGRAPEAAKVHPCLERSGDLGAILDELGGLDVLQVLVEGGATTAHAFHQAGLVDRYVLYLAPALFGGDDAAGLFRGSGAATMAGLWRGRILAVRQLGGDLRVDVDAGLL